MRKTAFAVLAAAALLAWPETAVNAAREAMQTWYYTVAPALFPFMLLMPMLAGPEAAAAYERLLGRLMRPVFGLPGAAAPAIVIGMTAGSPAGAAAVARIAGSAGLDRSTAERLAGCVCGLGPAFLISGLGASMLGSAADGALLLRSQIAAQLTMLLLSRRKFSIYTPTSDAQPQDSGSIRQAVLGVLGVCGYMVAFQIAASILAQLLRSERAGLAMLCVLDVPSGARAVAALSMEREPKLLLLSAMAGFGGLCILTQNLSACGQCGVRPVKLLASRLVAAVLSAGATALQLSLPQRGGAFAPSPMEISALTASFFAVPTWIYLANTSFLNKINFRRKSGFMPEKSEKLPHIVEKCGYASQNVDFKKVAKKG